jgi:lipopolysaccharide export system permease protein
LQAGAFKSLTQSVTAYSSGRGPNGKWQDVMIHDGGSARPSTYTARQATLQNTNGESFFILENGTQQLTDTQGRIQLVRFETYVLPLQRKPTALRAKHHINRNQLMIHQLLDPAAHGVRKSSTIRRMKARGLELIASASSPFIFMLISFAIVTGGGINRQGYGRRILLAVGLALIYQIGIIRLAYHAVDNEQAWLVFVWPTVFFIALMGFIIMRDNPALLRMRTNKAA